MNTTLRTALEIGNIFAIPLGDGTFAIGQVLAHEQGMLGAISCAFYGLRYKAIPSLDALPMLDETLLIASHFTGKDRLVGSHWTILGKLEPILSTDVYPYESQRVMGWAGAKMIGTAILEEFLQAYWGLAHWDNWGDPNYLDGVLLPGNKRPRSARTKNDL